MKISSCSLGILDTNCYLLLDDKSGIAAVIDPGIYDETLIKMLSIPEIKKIEYILLTHGHFDHILGVKELKKMTGAKIAIHKEDEKLLVDPKKACVFSKEMMIEPIQPDIFLEDGDIISLGTLKIHVIHTPGHTEGGVCYICQNVLFSGDTLFSGSVGRTDFDYGNTEQILQSVQRIKNLNGDYKIMPGHGSITTLEKERRENPYLYRNEI